MSSKPELIFNEHLIIGEGPTWDYRNNKLYYIDIDGKALFTMEGIGGKVIKTELPQKIGCLGLCKNGDLLLALEDGVYRRNASGSLTLAHQNIKIKGQRFNDGKIGPDGCFYLGTSSKENEGAFYRLSNGVLTELFGKCSVSNGLDWSKDTKTMYYTDSPHQSVEAFDFSVDEHNVSNRRTLFNVPVELGCSDGMAIDEDGNIFVAVWRGSCVLHIDTKTGNVLDKIDVPAKKASCCCFAGENLDTLIITSAATGQDFKDDPFAGAMFACKPGVKGVKVNLYKDN